MVNYKIKSMKMHFRLSKLALLYSVIILIYSCRKEDDSTFDQSPTLPATVVTTIGGRVADESNNPVPFAKVTCQGITTVADSRGFYLFRNISVYKGRTVISAENEYYRTLKPVANGISYCDISITKLSNSHQLNAPSGGTVNDPSGVTIIFQPGSLKKSDGSVYGGNATIKIVYFDPTISNYDKVMPAHDNLLLDENGNKKFAFPFGTAKIELLSSGGQKLSLDPTKPATLSIPIAVSQSVSTPPSVQLSSFDPTTGIWKPEATAIKSGNNFVGNVTHFSWWGSIAPLGTATVNGYVKDIAGNPIANATVDPGLSFISGITDANGFYSMDVFDGISLYISSNQQRNMGIQTPYLTTPVLANGQVYTSPDLIFNDASIIAGNVVDCSGNSTLGFVTISDSQDYVIYTLTNTSFSLFAGTIKNVMIHAFQGNKYGEMPFTAGNSGTISVAGNISMCNFTPTAGNVTITFTSNITGTSTSSLQLAWADVTVHPTEPWTFININSDDSLYMFGISNYMVSFVLPIKNSFIPGTMPWSECDSIPAYYFDPVDMYGEAFGNTTFNIFYGYGYISPQSMGSTSITQIGPVGGFVTGTWTGPVEIYDISYNTVIVGEATMTFNITRRT